MKNLYILIGLGFLSSAVMAGVKDSKSNEGIRPMRIKARVIPAKDSAGAFAKALEDLKKKLARERDAKKRYEDFAQSVVVLRQIKEGPRPSSEEKAIEMAMVLETFEGLPTKKSYDPSKCHEHYEAAEYKMRNRSGDEPEDPGVVKGLEVLKLVCGSSGSN